MRNIFVLLVLALVCVLVVDYVIGDTMDETPRAGTKGRGKKLGRRNPQVKGRQRNGNRPKNDEPNNNRPGRGDRAGVKSRKRGAKRPNNNNNSPQSDAKGRGKPKSKSAPNRIPANSPIFSPASSPPSSPVNNAASAVNDVVNGPIKTPDNWPVVRPAIDPNNIPTGFESCDDISDYRSCLRSYHTKTQDCITRDAWTDPMRPECHDVRQDLEAIGVDYNSVASCWSEKLRKFHTYIQCRNRFQKIPTQFSVYIHRVPNFFMPDIPEHLARAFELLRRYNKCVMDCKDPSGISNVENLCSLSKDKPCILHQIDLGRIEEVKAVCKSELGWNKADIYNEFKVCMDWVLKTVPNIG